MIYYILVQSSLALSICMTLSFFFLLKKVTTLSQLAFYRPPSSPHDLDIFHNTLSALNPSYLLNLVLVGGYLSPPTKFRSFLINSHSFKWFKKLHTIPTLAPPLQSILSLYLLHFNRACLYSILPPACFFFRPQHCSVLSSS